MDKGSTGNFAIKAASGGPISDGKNCSNFHGTSDESGYNTTTGELTAQIVPNSGNWLDSGQTFCAFSINLTSTVWVTDGQGIFGPFTSTPDLIGIQQG
jgi:hypothetical protein